MSHKYSSVHQSDRSSMLVVMSSILVVMSSILVLMSSIVMVMSSVPVFYMLVMFLS